MFLKKNINDHRQNIRNKNVNPEYEVKLNNEIFITLHYKLRLKKNANLKFSKVMVNNFLSDNKGNHLMESSTQFLVN